MDETLDDLADRWVLWWQQLVSPLTTDPEHLRQVIREVKIRRGKLDADIVDADMIAADEVIDRLRKLGVSDPQEATIFFTTRALRVVLGELLGIKSVVEVGRQLSAPPAPVSSSKTEWAKSTEWVHLAGPQAATSNVGKRPTPCG